MRPRLLQLCPFPPELEAELARRFSVTRWSEADAARLAAHAGDIRAIATSGGTGVPSDLMDALPALELIAIHGVGYDRVDLKLARVRGVVVTNTPEVLTDDVADLAVALMLACARRLPAADAFVRLGAWTQNRFPLGRKASGLRYGILGLGRIGSAIAKRLEGFGGEIAYVARSAKPAPYVAHASALELAQWADVLIVAASSTAGAPPLVDRAVIEALGPEGMLVNVARGGLVDEVELVAALTDGRLGAAALDVFVDEPDVPEPLRSAPNVVLAPHIGSATVETRAAMDALMLANLDAWLAGRPAPTPVE